MAASAQADAAMTMRNDHGIVNCENPRNQTRWLRSSFMRSMLAAALAGVRLWLHALPETRSADLIQEGVGIPV
jgi:hypothetical protein